MQLNSVRELKASLPAHLERAFAARAPRVTAVAARGRVEASTAVALAAARERRRPGYFLGVAPRGRAEYALAVRLQDHALEGSALVGEITARARGEVDVRYVGAIRARRTAHRGARARAKAHAKAPARWYRHRQRPLLIGSSVGYIATAYVMAGTLGCFVRRSAQGQLFILSNNHVLADENRYAVGGAILQPGALDGGRTGTDQVAALTTFVALRDKSANLVDCAMARLEDGIDADVHTLKGIGTLGGVRTAPIAPRDAVHKVGRTTGVRHGRVTAIELDSVMVEYDMGTISFDGQIEIEGAGNQSFSDAGDSGSLIVDDEMQATGLLFAGGDHGGSNGKGVTYANAFEHVLSELKVQLAY